MKRTFQILAAVIWLAGSAWGQGMPQAEKLDHALTTAVVDGGILVSWRSLETDSERNTYTVIRDGKRVASFSSGDATCWLDSCGTAASDYALAIGNGRKRRQTIETPFITFRDTVRDPGTGMLCPYTRLQLNLPAPGSTPDNSRVNYSVNDMSVGDLDGDGRYELVVKWDPENSKDNAHSGYTANVLIDAYRMNGEFLWRIDLGRNIRAGAHYTQFMVFDLDGDGKAEVAMKTSDGTTDGQGKVIGKADADYRNPEGRIISGNEYLTIFEGETGRELTTINYYPPRSITDRWGDNYGNRSERMLACVAYLDGLHPSLVMCRGYYTNTYVVAYDFDGKQLRQRWVCKAENSRDALYGQGNHNIFVGDIDGLDGCDEIVYGGTAIGHDGKLLYSTGLGHGDAGHLGDLDPDSPGLEFWDVHESKTAEYSDELRAADGHILWGTPQVGKDNGRGMAADIDPRYPGYEMWSNAGGGIHSCKGELISGVRPSVNFRIYWDGDLLDELFDATGAGTGGKIEKWNWETGRIDRLFSFAQLTGTSLNNGTKSNPCLLADLAGDWREEFIVRRGNGEVCIFTTPYLTEHRVTCLMQDHTYRMAIATQNVAYNQPPHPGYLLNK